MFCHQLVRFFWRRDHLHFLGYKLSHCNIKSSRDTPTRTWNVHALRWRQASRSICEIEEDATEGKQR
jgi:hypothetical protein